MISEYILEMQITILIVINFEMHSRQFAVQTENNL